MDHASNPQDSMPSDASDADTPQLPRRAARSTLSWLLFLALSFTGLVVDLWSKQYAYETLRGDSMGVTLLKDLLYFRYTENRGIVFGLAQGGRAIFIPVSILAVLVILVVFIRSRSTQWWLHTALALICAGALGNLYDRAALGFVRDFILMTPKIWPWIFNVADAMLCIGVAMLMLWVMTQDSKPKPAQA